DPGSTWHSASTQGAISGIASSGYTGSFVWKGGTDLPGFDGVVLLRVMPNNGTNGFPDSTSVRVDYNQPPTITASPLAGEHSGEIAIPYTVTDPEKDTVEVICEYSTDGGTTYHNTDWASGKWNTMTDLGYVYARPVQLRLTPKDQEMGTLVTVGPFTVTNLVGDYTHDFAINGNDLLVFSDAWSKQDKTKEIGPVTGTPPELTVTPDGAVDFKDLSVFAWMWNWRTLNPRTKVIAEKPASDYLQASDHALELVSSVSGEMEVVSRERLDFLSLEAEPLPQGRITLTGSAYWDSDGKGIVLTREYENGVSELAASRLDKSAAPSFGSSTVAALSIPANPDIEKLIIRYKLRRLGDTTIYEGIIGVSEQTKTMLPAEIALFQNTPNPFNPSTAIEYALPREMQVTLKVFNVSGQQVGILVNGKVGAGKHAVVWDAAGMPTGIYYYTLRGDGFVETKRMLLLK
ncbi:MAG: T9SS type A sorting domain-containing protein, partial [Candidatus Latescibacterota bacterium]